jgi:hypothetical protein
LEASAEAPAEAICPTCGGTVQLRRRKLMRSRDVTYYWRHASNQHLRCHKRSRPSFLPRRDER